MLSFEVFLQGVCGDPVKLLSFNQPIQKCNKKGLLKCVSKTTINEYFDYGTLGLICRMEVDLTLVFKAVTCLSENDLNALG